MVSTQGIMTTFMPAVQVLAWQTKETKEKPFWRHFELRKLAMYQVHFAIRGTSRIEQLRVWQGGKQKGGASAIRGACMARVAPTWIPRHVNQHDTVQQLEIPTQQLKVAFRVA